MASLMAEIGMPRKVLRKTQELGVHNDCVVSGKPCEQCQAIIVLAFDFFYGDEPLGDKLAHIWRDMRDDLEENDA